MVYIDSYSRSHTAHRGIVRRGCSLLRSERRTGSLFNSLRRLSFVPRQRADLRQTREESCRDGARKFRNGFKIGSIVSQNNTHGVGIAALVANPDARSPFMVVGVE